MAVADLGGLGANEGPLVAYHWTPPSLFPSLLPWLGLCVLLLAPANRSRRAWWLLVPVAAVLFFLTLPPYTDNDRELEMLRGLARPMAFGLAAVWALAFLWVWKHRFLSWLAASTVCGAVAALVLLLRAVQGQMAVETAGMAFAVLVWSGLLASQLWLTGVLCRRQYQPRRVLLTLMAVSLSVHAALAVPIVLCLWAMNAPAISADTVLGIIFVPALLGFALLLPFLVLSFTNDFYRERLQGMLHLSREPSPPMLKPDAAVVAK